MDKSSQAKSDTAAKLARNLIRCRRAAGLTQEDLAIRASLNRSQISLLEQAKRQPTIDTLLKLAGGLGVEPAELLREMKWVPTEKREGRFRVEEEQGH